MDSYKLVLNNMKRVGFSEYEAKAYLNLLEHYPVNGYTLSKTSGIPRSRIYEVLNNLLEKQMVFEQIEGKNTLYYPVSPETFLSRIKTEYSEVFDTISEFARKAYRETTQNENLVVIKGRKNILDFIRLLIRGAETRIALSIWEEDFAELCEELRKAKKRKVILRGVFFGEKPPFPELVTHRRLQRLAAEKTQRYISIIVDRSTVLSGVISHGDTSKATWTHDEGFVDMSEDFIAHDLVINLYSKSLDKKSYTAFEEFTENVLRNFYLYSEEETNTYKNLIS